ncbi:MAG: HRDC domain-containing protein, partial [Candidatus Rokuibacteriota bacterium]
PPSSSAGAGSAPASALDAAAQEILGGIESVPGVAGQVPDAAAAALFEALRRERLQLAQQEQVAPFIVASDRTLRDIALLRPRTLDELRLAHGIGPHKAERYGARWLEVVRHGGAEMAPEPPAPGTPRQSRGAPR